MGQFRGLNSDDFPFFGTSLALLEAELAPFKDWAKSSSSSSLLFESPHCVDDQAFGDVFSPL